MRSLPALVWISSFLVTSVSAQVVAPILSGSAQTTVTAQGSWRRGLAVAPDGGLWSLVRGIDATGSSLALHASFDGGATWSPFPNGDLPSTDVGAGAIAFGVECTVLHCFWHAKDGTPLHDVHYATFDTSTAQWSAVQQLTNAVNSDDQYYAHDVQVTPRGTVVCVLSTHRTPQPAGTFTSGWSTGLFVKPRGGAFSSVIQVNTDSYGQSPDAQTIGETVHLAFRTNTGLYGTRYRAFDTETMSFVTPADVQVEQGTSNVSSIAADDSGGLYVVYNTGGSSPGSGEIRVAYAAPGAHGTWTPQTVAADPELLKGNVAYTHYSLMALDGGLVAAVYSKVSGEQRQTLYYRMLLDGQFVTPELVLVASTDADRFAVVSGLRSRRTLTVGHVVVESRAAIHPGRQVDFVALATGGRVVRFGLACGGSLPQPPELAIPAAPLPGTTLPIELRDLPAAAPAAVFLDIGCATVPVPLDAVGMPGCALYQSTALGFPLTADGNGEAGIGLPIPANTTISQITMSFQALVLAPGANPLGVVSTGNAGAWFP